ncbi:MAG: A/G-specific adenine glycosylase [Candidatus Hydrogenedentes bacterium]|nr:A/G-specific adenine glycosylase [Candidatus Hydrogenedentota bacterium]
MAPIESAKKKRAAIRRGLLAWYRREARDLPWRRTKDPYAVWLSEIMLQQTRVDQGTPYFERFIAAFPTVQALAAAKDAQVLKLWEGLGYYSRARNLHRAAKIVAHEMDGAFPATAEAWRALPGVGRYTAGAIASIAFDEPVAVLDGNVIRVLSRIFDITESTDDTRTRDRLWEIAETLVPQKSPGDFNQAMMELGARVCTPRAPQCAECPVRLHCDALSKGVQEQRPVRKKKAATPHYEYVVGVIPKNGRYLLAKRPDNGLLGGMWEFPGGPVLSGETHQAALKRILREEFGVTVKPGGLIAVVNHAYSHFKVTMNVYRCDWISGTPTPAAHTKMKWVPRSRFANYAFPKANHKFLDLL